MAYLELGRLDADLWTCPREYEGKSRSGDSTVCYGAEAEVRALFKRLQRTLNRFRPITGITLEVDGVLGKRDHAAAAMLIPDIVGIPEIGVQDGIFRLASKADEIEPALDAKAAEMKLEPGKQWKPQAPKGQNRGIPTMWLIGGALLLGAVVFGSKKGRG